MAWRKKISFGSRCIGRRTGQINVRGIVRAAPATAIDIRQCGWRQRGVVWCRVQ
jgi:hypothetical protein